MCGRFTGMTYDEVLDLVERLEMFAPLSPVAVWPAQQASGPAPAQQTPGSASDRQASGFTSGQWASDSAPMPPAKRPSVYPGNAAWTMCPAGEHLGIEKMIWGFDVSWQRGVVFNTRIESALGGTALWRGPIANGRCIVPAVTFFEPHQTEQTFGKRSGSRIKRPYVFGHADHTPCLLAAVSERGRFSIVTTEPNAVVSQVHPRMPLVLMPDEVPIWFSNDFPELADRSRVELTSRPIAPLANGSETGTLHEGSPTEGGIASEHPGTRTNRDGRREGGSRVEQGTLF